MMFLCGSQNISIFRAGVKLGVIFQRLILQQHSIEFEPTPVDDQRTSSQCRAEVLVSIKNDLAIFFVKFSWKYHR